MLKARRGTAREGYSLVELMLVMALIALFIGIIYFIYTKIKTTQAINAGVQKVQTAISVVENVAAQIGGYYPAENSAVDISQTPPFSLFLGSNKAGFANWTYQCPEGTDSTVTLYIPASAFGSPKDAPDICQAVALNIRQNTNWYAACDSAGDLTVTREHSVCKPTS